MMDISVTIGTADVYVTASVESIDGCTPELADHYLGRCRQQALVAWGQVEVEAESG